MAFNGKEGGIITLEAGSELTANYRMMSPGDIKGHFYGKDVLNDLLSQSGCMGIRIYYGVNNEGIKELVLVGTNSAEDDMTELVVDISCPCPNRCGRANLLNS